MNRSTIINTVVAAVIVLLVGAVFVLEGRGEGTPATTTTTSTSTTVAPTTSTTTTTTSTTTTSTTTTSTSSTTTTEPPVFEESFARALYAVVVVNGTTAGERLSPTIDQLIEIGYANVRGLVGAVQATSTVVYYVDGAAGAADRMRTDLGLDIEIVPLDQAPPVAGRNDAQLILYLGGS